MTHSISQNEVTSHRSTGGPTGFSIQLQCPVCRNPLTSAFLAEPHCDQCGFVMSKANGIFRALTPAREQHFSQFIREYEAVRAQEGRGSSSPDFYLSLPYKDLTGNNLWQWQIRARTFRCLEKQILPEVERIYPRGCDLLDIGAGNCWLSYRMALRGHRPVAVDLLDNDTDGLGAARHYLSRLPTPFPRFRAEMDRLPFTGAQFDVIVYNASFHYSADYSLTLGETLRCLRRPGLVIIADTAFYQRDESGQAMLAERRAAFQHQFGFRSDSIASLEYLTPASLQKLARSFSLHWNAITPWYGLKWAVRPWKARLLGRREPSRFHLLWAEVRH